jgi:hypothetical protein
MRTAVLTQPAVQKHMMLGWADARHVVGSVLLACTLQEQCAAVASMDLQLARTHSYHHTPPSTLPPALANSLLRVTHCSSGGFAVKRLQLSLDNCIQVLPGQLQLVEPAWSAMRRGYMTAGSATVLRLGTAGEGSDGLYRLPVALFDGLSPKTANRWAGATQIVRVFGLPASVCCQLSGCVAGRCAHTGMHL